MSTPHTSLFEPACTHVFFVEPFSFSREFVYTYETFVTGAELLSTLIERHRSTHEAVRKAGIVELLRAWLEVNFELRLLLFSISFIYISKKK